MSPYSTAIADSLSTSPFNWMAAPVVVKEHTRLRNGSLIADLMTAQEKQAAHRESVRIYDKRKRDEERAHTRMASAARRVNPETHWAAPSGFALQAKEIRTELARAV